MHRLDGLTIDGKHLDASESAFVQRELENLQKRVYEVKRPNLKARSFMSTVEGIGPADEGYRYEVLEHFGKAKQIRDYSNVEASGNVKKTEVFQKIIALGDAYMLSNQEIRASLKNNTNLPSLKAMAVRRSMAELEDSLLLIGSSADGLTGLFTASGTTTYTVPSGVAGDTEWSQSSGINKTPEEVLDDLHGMVEAVTNGTNGVEQPDTIILPYSSYQYIARKRLGDGDSTTILKYFMENAPGISRIDWSLELESNTAWTGKRAVCYSRSPEVVQAIIGMEFMQHPAQVKDLSLKTIVESRCGGVAARYPKAICYADGI